MEKKRTTIAFFRLVIFSFQKTIYYRRRSCVYFTCLLILLFLVYRFPPHPFFLFFFFHARSCNNNKYTRTVWDPLSNLGWRNRRRTARRNQPAYPWAARGASVLRSAVGFSMNFPPRRFPSTSAVSAVAGFAALHTIIFELLTNMYTYITHTHR